MYVACVSTAGGVENEQPAALVFSGIVKSDLKERRIKIRTQWSLPLVSSHPICPPSSPRLLLHPAFSSLITPLTTFYHFLFLSLSSIPPSLLSLSLLLLCDISCIIKGDHCSSGGQHQSAVSDVLHYECVSVCTETYVWVFGGWSSHDWLVWKI